MSPIAFCASECQKHMVKCTVSMFWLILSLLASIFRPSCSKMASRMAQHRAKLLQNCSPWPPNSQKTNENLMFFNVFQYLACLPKWLQNAPQIDPEAAKFISKWLSWRSCWPILALLVAILAPSWAPRCLQMELGRHFFRCFFEAFGWEPSRHPQSSKNAPKMLSKWSQNWCKNYKKLQFINRKI